MLVLVTYDVNTETPEGKKRLRKVAKTCTKYGVRVQNSVFECDVDASQVKLLCHEILSVIDEKKDSVRFYNLGDHYTKKIEHYGAKPTFDQEGPLVF
jgi:CRISPR-associated protein Cas2